MDFCILGPLEVLDRGQPVGLGGRKQRALLALLLLHAGEAVSTDRLVDELWGERPPATAAKLVQGYVAALRKLLPDGVLVTRPPGYLLELDGAAHSLDLHRFETLVAAAKDAAPERAVGLLREALALWRGPALGDLWFGGLAASEAAGLDGSRLVALTQRIELELALGRHADLVGELENLVAEHPFQERLRAQLILALYRSGRQAEALEAYRDARRALDELGIAPSAELERLEKAVLTHDQSLETPLQPEPLRTTPPTRPSGSATLLPTDFEGSTQTDAAAPAAVELVRRARPVYRRPLVIGTFAGVLAAAIAIAVFALDGGSGGTSISRLSANSVGVVDPASGKLVDDVLDVPTPARAAAGEGAIWVTSPDSQVVSRIDPQTREVRQTIPVGSSPTGVAVGGGDVWVANTFDGTVSRIDPAVNRVVDTIRVGKSPTALAFGDGSLWVANLDDQTLTRIDGRSGSPVKTKRVDAAARGIAFGGGSVWLSDGARNRVVRVDPRTYVTQTINVGSGPTAVKYGAGSLWVANSLDGTVTQIDPNTNAVTATIPVGSGPNGIAVSGNDVWVTDETGSSLVRLDAVKGSVAAKMRLGSRPGGVALADGSLFVTAQGSATAHRGGTLTLRGGSSPGPDSIDPARSVTPLSLGFLSITNDGLVAFKRVGGGDGTQLVPDLATSLPESTDGGKTYSFQLRRGIRFSNGRVVTPEDVRHSIEREFAINDSPGQSFFAGIEGATACAKTRKRCDLSRGIVTDLANRTVTFHLTRPDPDFLYKLATPAGAVVPADAPRAEAKRPLPATGPYMIASYDPKGRLTLVRNPRFRVWSEAAKPDGYPDELRWTWPPKANNDAAIDAVEHGRADVAFEAVAGSRAGELTTQYASQVHSTPLAWTDYWVMNTRRPPFDDLRVRRAVNYALDRNELIRRHGGPLTAQPSCQILPPNFPGYRPYCPYTLHPNEAGTWSAPDLAKARALVRASGTRGAEVTLSSCSCILPVAEIRYVRRVLERLGYRVTLDLVSTLGAFLKQVSPLRQIVSTGWGADYPAASNFFGNAIACGGYANRGKFCDRALDREVKRATVLQQTNPRAASDLWAKVDRQATDQAPWIVEYTPRHTDLLSKRVGNYQHHPMYNILLDQLWVR